MMATSTLEGLGFYDITKEPSDPEVARLRKILREIEDACLRGNGPLAFDRDMSTLLAIGQAVESLFGD